jgi:alpha-tubulin suppressor-like RCC1 family protein
VSRSSRPGLSAVSAWTGAIAPVLLLVLSLGTPAPVAIAAAPLAASSFNSSPLAVGGNFACALPGDGTVRCWGDDSAGQLGNGQVLAPGPSAGAGATLATVISGAGSTAPLTGVVGIAAGFDHACALLADTSVRCWGDNAVVVGGQLGPLARSGGELGDGTTENRPAPVTVVEGPGQTAPLSGVKALSAANGYTCAVLQDGSAKCWGEAPQRASLAPVAVLADAAHPLTGIVGISAGDRHACALLTGGSVVCWGADESGQLGDQGSAAKSAMPVKVTIAGGPPTFPLGGVDAVTVGHNIDLNENGISVGHSCALDATGGVLCWGTNGDGQLGDGSIGFAGGDGRPFAAPVIAAPGSGDSLSGVAAIAAGNAFTCALMTDGGVKCWGLDFGAPADGAPVSVPSLAGVVSIAAGGEACAVLADGTVRCWTGQSGPAAVAGLQVSAPSPSATATPMAADVDGLVGDWAVTYGSPSVVSIRFADGMYSVIGKTPVQVTGAACSLPAGTLIATFDGSGGSYSGRHGVWWTNSCGFDQWAAMTATLGGGGRTITATIAGLPGTTVFTREARATPTPTVRPTPTPAASPPAPITTDVDGLAGGWDATNGFTPPSRLITFGGGSYTVTTTTPVKTTAGGTCTMPPGSLIATFTGSGGAYIGRFSLWLINTCVFEGWTNVRGRLGAGAQTLTWTAVPGGQVYIWRRAVQAAPTPPSFRSSVPTPAQVNLSPAVLAASLALAGGVIVLVPFPGSLFNSTLRANYDEITRRARRARRRARDVALRPWDGLRRRLGRDGGHGAGQAAVEPASDVSAAGEVPPEERHDFWWSPFGVGLFILLTALLSGFLDPAFGLNEPSIATFVGMLIGLAVVLAAFDLPLALLYRRRSVDFWMRALPATVAVSVACVLISRLTDFHPGYLYGLVIAIVAAEKFDKRTEGRLMAAGTLTTIAVAAVAWFGLGVVSPMASASADPGPPLIVVQTALSMVVVAGVQVVAFGMLPLSFLAGESVKQWSLPVWAALLAFGWVAFGIVILNPQNGYLSDTTRTPLFTIVALLVLFSVGSVLFWYYFHRHPAIERGTGA